MNHTMEIINNLGIRIAQLEVDKAVLAVENKSLKETLEKQEMEVKEDESSD